MIKKYDKLVRDRIPEIIGSSGHEAVVSKLTEAELESRLIEKLVEEQKELDKDRNVEEVADMLEILFSLARRYGHDEKQTLELMYKKREARGGFEEGYLLTEVHLKE
jgi:predicted house-cleaning noncanonical NTP pyrophosphatase (MazG superfamily)